MKKRKKKVEQRYRWDKHRWGGDVCVRCGTERKSVESGYAYQVQDENGKIIWTPILVKVYKTKKGSNFRRGNPPCEIEKPTPLYGYPNKKAKEMIKYFCEVGTTTYFDMPYEYRGMYGRMWTCKMLVEVNGQIKPTELMHEMNRKYNKL